MAADRKTILVDFDGVLHSYASGWQGIDVIPDPPFDNALAWLLMLTEDDGFDVCIYSARSAKPEGIAAMMAWLVKHGFPRAQLAALDFPSQKPPAFLTIDDRAFAFEGRYPPPDEIRAFKPWYERETEASDGPASKAAYDDAEDDEDAAMLHQEEHICYDCAHRAVCKGQDAVSGMSEMLITIRRCKAYVPFAPEIA